MTGPAGPIGAAQTGQPEVVTDAGWVLTGSGGAATDGTFARSGWAWSGSGEYESTITVAVLPTYGKGLLLVAQTAGGDEYFLELRYRELRIAKQTGGSYPWAADPAYGTVAAGDTVGFRVTVSGSDKLFEALLNGVVVGSKTDTAPLGVPDRFDILASSGSVVEVSGFQVADLG
jgi:hypothetical protein